MSALLEGLNNMQRQAVTTTEGPVLVIAGAGSGKTTVITRRIGYILEQHLARPWEILAITFTNKAAAEMLERVTKLIPDIAGDIWIKTFHSACLRILRRDIDKLGYSSNFNIYDTADQKRLVKECIKQCMLNEENFPVKSVMGKISAAKNASISCEEFAVQNEADFRMKNYARIYTLYQKKLKENNALDFDDLIGMTVQLFEQYPDVLAYYQDKFKYIMVDEYQDTNNAQYRLVAQLAAKHKNLCVVGDDDQSIYKFRGADITNILDFERQFAGAVNIKLEQNYRSTQTILDAANGVISNNFQRKEKKLWTDAGAGEKILLRPCTDQVDEAMYIGREIETLVSSGQYRYGDIAILYRTNAQTRSFEENLTCPYRILSGLRFYDRKEIKDMLSYLRVLFNPADDVNLLRIINVPKRGIGDTTMDKISAMAASVDKSIYEIVTDPAYTEVLGRAAGKIHAFMEMMEDLRGQIDRVSVPELIDAVLDKSGYLDALLAEHTAEAAGRIENLEELKSKAVEYEKNVEEPSFAGFLDNISLVSDIDNYDEQQDAVVMMTLHSAKGLEFPVVFICGMEKGLFPSFQSEFDPEQIEEERRLCYVGITRAKKRLYLTYARTRTLYGKTESRVISGFVGEIPRELLTELEPARKPRVEYHFTDNESAPSFQDKKKQLQSVLDTYGIGVKKPVSSASFSLKKGDRVLHRKFGEGMITAIHETAGDTEIEVSFDNVGTRRLMASFAKLKKIG